MHRLPRLAAAAAAVVLASATAAGCAGGGSQEADSAKDFKGEQAAVAKVLDDLAGAANDRDGKEVCDSLLSADLKRRLGGDTKCAEALENQLADASDLELETKSVSIEGARATATAVSARDGDDATVRVPLIREGRAWRLAGPPVVRDPT